MARLSHMSEDTLLITEYSVVAPTEKIKFPPKRQLIILIALKNAKEPDIKDVAKAIEKESGGVEKISDGSLNQATGTLRANGYIIITEHPSKDKKSPPIKTAKLTPKGELTVTRFFEMLDNLSKLKTGHHLMYRRPTPAK